MSTPETFSHESSIKIDSKERLRTELGITSPLDIPEISRAFEVTRKDLEDFRKTLDTVPSAEQLEKIKAFITEKSEVVSSTRDKADAFKKTLAVGGVGVIFTGMWTTFKEGMADLQNTEGLDMVDKGSSLWDKLENMWDKAKLALAQTKLGKMFLDFFGFEIPSVESVMDDVGEKWKELTKEKKQEIEEKLFGTLSADLKKQYNFNGEEKLSDGTTKGDKLRAILKKRVDWVHETFVDENGTINLNLKNVAALTGTGLGLVYELVREWVINVSNIAFDFVETTKGTIRYVAKSISGVEMSPEFGGEVSLATITENMTSGEKMFLLAIFYRKGGFITSMLGDIGYILAQPMRFLNTDNISTLSVLVPWVNKKIEKMDQIIATLSKIAPEKAADIAALKEMREAAVLNKKALEAVVSYKNGTITYEAAQKELGVLKQKYKPLSWMKTGAIEGLGLDAWNKAYMKDMFISRNANYIESLSHSINPDKFRTLAKIRAYGQFLEIPGNLNKTVVHFKNPTDFRGFMKEVGVLASQSPELVRWLFSHLPVFIVAGTTIHEGMKPDGEVLKSLRYFVPIWWPALMIWDANIWINRDGTIDVENIGEGVAGFVLGGIDLWIFTKLVWAKWKMGVVEFALKPVIDTTRAIGSLGRLSWSLWKVGADGARLGAQYLSKFPSYGKVAAGALAGITILLITGEALASDSPEEIKKKLTESKLLNADGTPNLIQMKERFKTLSPENKKQILDLVFSLEISLYTIDQYIEKTEYEKGVYVVKVKKEHRSIIEKTLLATNIYSEFELIDNIRIETIES